MLSRFLVQLTGKADRICFCLGGKGKKEKSSECFGPENNY